MSKITIASAVLAGFKLSERLEELGIEDEVLAKHVSDLGSHLGNVMSITEKVQHALAIISQATKEGDYDCVVDGVRVVRLVVDDLVSGQAELEAAMGVDSELVELAIMEELLREILGAPKATRH